MRHHTRVHPDGSHTDGSQADRLAPPRTTAGFALVVGSTVAVALTALAPAVGVSVALGVVLLALVARRLHTADAESPDPSGADPTGRSKLAAD